MPLVVTGTVGIDTIYTPDGEHREGILGGSCTYFAAAAAFYGPVRLVAAVGDDFPAEHRAMLSRFPGIDLAGLEVREGSRTFRWGGRYMEQMDQRETLFTELGVLEEMPPQIPDAYRDSKYVFLANTHPAVQLEMIANFPNRAMAVADTMDLWIDTARDELQELLERVDGLVLNYDEAEQLTKKRNTVAAANHILEMGPRFVVVKKGEHGCVLVHKDGLAALPAYPNEDVVDPTGAGDSFAGGMMGHIASQGRLGNTDDPASFETIRRALAHGTIIASFNIEAFSLERLAGLSNSELESRYNEFSRMLRL
jgi:sugar/nucleoside kinase (ribokinase family)